ncbi:MAG: hypothetical protein KGH75_00025 [Rhodospirillales bacterium]|nr:hypothetical protein [Rhodospirillales bacterium]
MTSDYTALDPPTTGLSITSRRTLAIDVTLDLAAGEHAILNSIAMTNIDTGAAVTLTHAAIVVDNAAGVPAVIEQLVDPTPDGMAVGATYRLRAIFQPAPALDTITRDLFVTVVE